MTKNIFLIIVISTEKRKLTVELNLQPKWEYIPRVSKIFWWCWLMILFLVYYEAIRGEGEALNGINYDERIAC